MGQDAYKKMCEKIANQEKKFGKQPTGKEVEKKAREVAERHDRRNK